MRHISLYPNAQQFAPSLVELSLSRNRLTDDCGIWSVVAFIPNLQRLNLSHNLLSVVPHGLEAPADGVSLLHDAAATPSGPDAFPRLQWLNLAANNIQHDEVIAALLSYAQNLRQLILFDNPIAKPLLPSELKEQRFADLKLEDSVQEGLSSGAGAAPAASLGPSTSSMRVVNIVTDGNAATAGMAAADDATRSAAIGVGMMKGTRRAAAQRAAVHSAALAAAQVVEGAVQPHQRRLLLNGSAAVPQGMAALDAALGANIGAAYTALRHRRGGSLFAVSDDTRQLRSAREALGGLTLQSSRRDKLRSALLKQGTRTVIHSKFASETQASLSRSTGERARRRADGSRAALESPAARRALKAAGTLAQLGNPPRSLVKAQQTLGHRAGGRKTSTQGAILPSVSSAVVTDDDLAAVAATLVAHEQPAVPVRLSAALNALRHAVQQPSGDDARMAQLMAKAAASRRAAQRSRKQ